MTALYRRYIREVLFKAHPFAMTEPQLVDCVDRLVAGPLDISEFREAMEWNLARDFIRSRKNDDTDAEEWRLTKLGKAKHESGEG